jgi:hypothetical protein
MPPLDHFRDSAATGVPAIPSLRPRRWRDTSRRTLTATVLRYRAREGRNIRGLGSERRSSPVSFGAKHGVASFVKNPTGMENSFRAELQKFWHAE